MATRAKQYTQAFVTRVVEAANQELAWSRFRGLQRGASMATRAKSRPKPFMTRAAERRRTKNQEDVVA